MAKRPSRLLDLPAPQGARKIGLFYVDRAQRALDRLNDPSDAEALHDFRVSLRRLRTNLQAYGAYLSVGVGKKLRRKIRDLAATTGGGRDSEVHLSWLESRRDELSPDEIAGFQALVESLEASREAGYAQAAGGTAARFGKLRQKLERRLGRVEAASRDGGLYAGVSFATAVERVLPAYSAEVDMCLSRVHTIADVGEAHRARIRAKRLRYILEPIASEVEGVEDVIDGLKNLQDLLGALRDAQLLEALAEDRLVDRPPESGVAAQRPGLERVGALLREEQARLFAQVRQSWLGEASGDFFAAVEAVCERLGATHPADIEIERKYLLTELPSSITGRPYRHIDQGYLPGARLQERVRRIRERGGERYVRTVKVGAGIRRAQLEEEADPEVFRALWPLTDGRRLTKRRYRVPVDGLVWEIDEFTDRDLVLAEVELPAVDVVPEIHEWLRPYVVREVTDEAEYLNVNLAR